MERLDSSGLVGGIRAVIREHSMFRRKDRVLVGVSGGPDSLALLSVLVGLASQLGIILRACYVDHGLRPAAGRKEAELVRRYGRMWGVPVTVVRKKVPERGGLSPEASARKVRYQALVATARQLRCVVVAVGHTADDQAETVLMRLLRGSGTAGLAGIPPVRVLKVPGRPDPLAGIRLVRPLIGCFRKDISSYLKQHGIHPLLDRSNLSRRFTRNRVRRELVVQLESRYNPQLRRHLCETAEILRSDYDWLERQVAAEFRRTARRVKRGIRLNTAPLKKMHPALRRGVLRLAVERVQGDVQGFGYRHWVGLERMVLGGRVDAADLPHGFRAEVIDGGKLFLRRANL